MARDATILMFVAAILMVAFKGFHVTSDMESLPVSMLLDPAGYAFIIWLFIYIGFIAFGFYQAQPARIEEPRFVRARIYIIFNVMANSLWFIGVLMDQMWLTQIFILIMLYTLIRLAVVLKLGDAAESSDERFRVKWPIGMYLGWITVATPVSTASFLMRDLGWVVHGDFGAIWWAMTVLIFLFLMALWVYFRQKVNDIFLLTVAWGLFAIYVDQQGEMTIVGKTAFAMALIYLLIWAIRSIRQKRLMPA